MPVLLGGPKARGVKIYGDIVVCRQYVNGEPALVMFPKRRRSLGNQGAFIVCLSSAWKYVDDAYVIQRAKTAAEVMGMHPDRSTVVRIALALNNELPELVMMKPEPGEAPKVIGEGRLEGAGPRPIDFELTDEMLRVPN